MTDRQSVAALVARTEAELRKEARAVYVPMIMLHVRAAIAFAIDEVTATVLFEYAAQLRAVLNDEYGLKVRYAHAVQGAGATVFTVYGLQEWYESNKPRQ